MDSHGQIHEVTPETEFQLENAVPVEEQEMTQKQRETRQVSPKDQTSPLGKRLGKFRNSLCSCGSGRKVKKCCVSDGIPD